MNLYSFISISSLASALVFTMEMFVDWGRFGNVAQAVSQALIAPMIGIATVVIGILAVRIQREQAKINRRQADTNSLQLRLALFERRMAVFDSTLSFINFIVRDARVEVDDLFKFLRETRQHELLFGPEIRDYITLLYKKGIELRSRRQVRSTEQGGFDKETELLLWFSTQTQEAATLFHRYIDFTEP